MPKKTDKKQEAKAPKKEPKKPKKPKKGPELSNRQVTDDEFWPILRANGGMYTQTAEAIQKILKVSYTRQAARDRAEKTEESRAELEDIREEALDKVEGVLVGFLKGKDPKIKMEAIKLFLKAKGHRRGYAERVQAEVNLTVNKKPAWFKEIIDEDEREAS